MVIAGYVFLSLAVAAVIAYWISIFGDFDIALVVSFFSFLIFIILTAVLLPVGTHKETDALHDAQAKSGWTAIERNGLDNPLSADHIQQYGSDTELPYFIIKRSQDGITKNTPVQFGWTDDNGKYNDAEMPLGSFGVSLNNDDSAPTVQFIFVGEPGSYRPSFDRIFSDQPTDWIPTDMSPFINVDDVKTVIVTLGVTDYQASPFSDPIIKQLLLFSPK